MTPTVLTRLFRISIVGLLSMGAGYATNARAVTPAKNSPLRKTTQNKTTQRNTVRYTQDLSSFHSKLPLQISSVERLIALPDDDVKRRLTEYKRNELIEPIQVTASADDEQVLDFAGKIARPNKKLAIANFLRENFSKGEEIPGSNLRLVTLDEQAFNWLNRESVDDMFAKEHYELTVKSDDLKLNRSLEANFLTQLEPYLTKEQINEVRGKIAKGKNLSVDRDLLPPFARKMIRHHTVFKGPNCFHAALSFQSPLFPKSGLVNVREEPGYHRSMINYDEMWRVAQLEFYEIDPAKADIKYGDMILFFDAPKEPRVAVDFKTLRHAATYLFGGYVFAKGSKSANSPYIIRPLADEWSTWVKYTDNLGVKVFRRNLKHVNKAAIWDPSDWLY